LGVTAAFAATDGGSDGAKRAAAPAPAPPVAMTPPAPDDGAGLGPAFRGGANGGGGERV
jgi:hypothetical protein